MDFQYSIMTQKSVDEAIAAIEAALKERKFGLLWQLDLESKIKAKGIDFDMPYRVLEVCNPNEASQVLAEDPLAGYFLPCKIVVHEKDGKTHIGMPRPTVLMDLMNQPNLQATAKRVEDTLIAAIEAAK